MALRKREKILAAAAAAVLLLGGAIFLLSGSGARSLADLRADRKKLAADVDQKSAHVAKAEAMKAQLERWQRRSLPSDRDIARSLYQNWLLELTYRHKLIHADVKPGTERSSRNLFYVLPFTVRGQTTMEHLVRFLHDFYSAGNLDEVQHLSIKPVENSTQLEVTLSIEALVLRETDRHDKLTSEAVKRMVHANLDDCVKVIADRHPFSPYSPPSREKTPDRPAEPPKFDPTKFAYLSGVTEVDGQPRAWLRSRIPDKILMVSSGESFKLGAIQGTVVRIGEREVELEIDGVRHVLPLGTNLRDSKTVGEKPEAKPEDKPEDKPADKPEAKPDDKPVETSEAKPDDKPAETSDAKPEEKRGSSSGFGSRYSDKRRRDR